MIIDLDAPLDLSAAALRPRLARQERRDDLDLVPLLLEIVIHILLVFLENFGRTCTTVAVMQRRRIPEGQAYAMAGILHNKSYPDHAPTISLLNDETGQATIRSVLSSSPRTCRRTIVQFFEIAWGCDPFDLLRRSMHRMYRMYRMYRCIACIACI